MSALIAAYALVRDDGVEDAFTRRRFVSYDEAYDERDYYRIVALTVADADGC